MGDRKEKYESIEDAYARLRSSRQGLSDNEAKKRIQQYGYNEIKEKKPNPLRKLAKRFYGPIPFMLEAVMVITFILNDLKDLYVITALLIFNAIVGFFEERKADNAVELLKKKLNVNSRVLRSGSWSIIPARELVIGDIIRIRIGDIVPADAKIIEQSDLEVDQSVLTGESMQVKKKSGDIVYSGSVIKEGEATCLVTAIGYDTYYGHTTQLVQTAGAKSHLEHLILRITRYLLTFDAIIAVILFMFGVFIAQQSFAVMVPFVLIVLIASVPVALPAAFTVTMALGTEKLSDKSVLVTNLNAIEETSTIDTICFDKTGTLTQNRISVKEVFPIGKHTKNEVVLAALLASRKEDNDPIDTAVIEYAGQNKISANGYTLKEFSPFQPKTKMSSSKMLHNGKTIISMKGAYSVLEALCSADSKSKSVLSKKIDEFSRMNYRTIAVATGDKKPELLGVIALYDEPRKSAKSLIKELSALGLRIKMLTGDNLQIANEIAAEVGINEKIIDFSELKGENEEKMNESIQKCGGFAEIFPEDKYLIVKTLQNSHYKVGMSGDGVNDAPALKQAEVGIAVANATDVAKSVSGIVLVRNGLNVIIDAIKESRRVFERMLLYSMVKIVRVIQILLFILIAFMLLKQMPLLPFELILLIFTNDIVNIAISTDNAEYSKKPDVWNLKNITYVSLSLGVIFLMLTLIFIPIGQSIEPSIGALQTFIFFMLVVTDKLLIYSLRSKDYFWRSRPSKWLVLSSIAGVIAGGAFAYFGIFIAPISLFSMAVVIAISFIAIFIFDVIKVSAYRNKLMQLDYATA